MKKSSSAKGKLGGKDIEPPRRSTFNEVLDDMKNKGYFGGFRDCPYYRTGLNGEWDDSYNCFLNRKVDEECGERFCGECDFKADSYKSCPRYIAEQGRITRKARDEGKR